MCSSSRPRTGSSPGGPDRPRPGGPLRLRSCVVVELSPAGRVARAAEYVDSAQLAVLRHWDTKFAVDKQLPKRLVKKLITTRMRELELE